MEAAVIDFQAFMGIGPSRFIVKEVSVMDLDTLAEQSFLFKPPREIPKERSPCDIWLKKHHHHLEWSQGDIEYFMLEDVLFKSTKKFRFLFAKGIEKCDFLEGLLRKYVYDLEVFGCPALKKLAESLKCDRCPHHEGKKYVCAHLQTIGLAKWAVANKEKIDLRDPRVRLETFKRWSVLVDPSKLSQQGFVHIRKTKSGIRCVYCGLEMTKIDPTNDPQVHHKQLSPDCVYVKNK